MWTFVHTQVFPTAPTNLSSAFADILFQSTHPREVRHFPDSIVHHAIMFQSTHPRGVRRTVSKSIVPTKSFNPRTREGCDQNNRIVIDASVPFQSTHPRGVRLSSHREQLNFIHVSIHAPARGATANSFGVGKSASEVSIHAPARGATLQTSRKSQTSLFQSTHPRGVRHGEYTPFFVQEMFQSTHPRGVRRLTRFCKSRLHGFNPRTREGCDQS